MGYRGKWRWMGVGIVLLWHMYRSNIHIHALSRTKNRWHDSFLKLLFIMFCRNLWMMLTRGAGMWTRFAAKHLNCCPSSVSMIQNWWRNTSGEYMHLSVSLCVWLTHLAFLFLVVSVCVCVCVCVCACMHLFAVYICVCALVCSVCVPLSFCT